MNTEDEDIFRESCEGMEEAFDYMAIIGELSRKPTKQEIEKVFPIMRQRMETGSWGDSAQEMAHILCSVTDITTTLDP